MASLFYESIQTARQWYWKLFQIKTAGVRVIIEKEKKILLVKHRFGGPWLLPGGGIQEGESIAGAAIREVMEETSFAVMSFTRKLGTYKNNKEGKRDVVTILIANEWREPDKRAWNIEISDSGFFSPDNLPPGTSPATHARIKEYLSGELAEFSGDW